MNSEPPPVDRSCSQCGRPFPSGELLQFDHQFICAQCKPFYLQQLREGLPTEAETVRYAGFWIRGGAAFIDALLFYIVGALIWVVAGDTWKEAFGFNGPYPTVDKWTAQDWWVFTAENIVSLAYLTIMVTRYGGTLGKLALGLRVVNANGQHMTWKKAAARHFAVYLSMLGFVVALPDTLMLCLLPCLAGLIMAAFDSQKRALHDRLCGTRVTHRKKEPAAAR